MKKQILHFLKKNRKKKASIQSVSTVFTIKWSSAFSKIGLIRSSYCSSNMPISEMFLFLSFWMKFKKKKVKGTNNYWKYFENILKNLCKKLNKEKDKSIKMW